MKVSASDWLLLSPELFLTAAGLSLVVGYVLLHQGSTTAAPILLALGYCVFFPVGLAL